MTESPNRYKLIPESHAEHQQAYSNAVSLLADIDPYEVDQPHEILCGTEENDELRRRIFWIKKCERIPSPPSYAARCLADLAGEIVAAGYAGELVDLIDPDTVDDLEVLIPALVRAGEDTGWRV